MNCATVGELIFFLSSPECGKKSSFNEPFLFLSLESQQVDKKVIFGSRKVKVFADSATIA